jgi:hypothetical protein
MALADHAQELYLQLEQFRLFGTGGGAAGS